MQRPVTYPEIVKFLESQGMVTRSPLSLEPMHEGLRRIGFFSSQLFRKFQDDPRRIVILAGTNGKGSVGATLEALLQSAGQRTGFFSSPHLYEPTERIRTNGVDVTPGEFLAAFDEVYSHCKDLGLSYFEYLTLMAARIFSAKVDYAVFEVGLGGRWDPTNAVPHGMCVITQLGMDHQDRLGETLSQITENKLGVIPIAGMSPLTGSQRAQVVAVPLPKEARFVAAEVRDVTHCRWTELNPADFLLQAQKAPLPQFEISTPWGKTRLALPGSRGASNSALALQTFEKLGFNPQDHLLALEKVRWIGRMSPVPVKGAPCPVFFSGDHNPQGIESLLELLEFFERDRLHLVVGIGEERPFDEMLKRLGQVTGAAIYLTTPPYKGRTEQSYGDWAEKSEGYFLDPKVALEHACQRAQPGDLIVITGSLYLLSAVSSAPQT